MLKDLKESRPLFVVSKRSWNVEVLVRFVLELCEANRVNLQDWDREVMLSAAVAAHHPERIGRVPFCSSLYLCDDLREMCCSKTSSSLGCSIYFSPDSR